MRDADTTFLPCGCVLTTGMVDGRRTAVMRACQPDCATMRDFLALADEQSKSVDLRHADTITVTCLGCGKVLDAATPFAGEAALPEPGALSICAYCGLITAYDLNPDGDLYLRFLTPGERADVAQDPRVAALVAAIHRRGQ